MNSQSLLALYIHVPFCVRKCPYCDFYSLPGLPISESYYAECLIQELSGYRALLQDDSRPLSSIFFGGGTPSFLSGWFIQQVLDGVRALWPLAPECEISLEANPESCHAEKPELWKKAGITRISLGVQALCDERLLFLQRPHDLKMARQALTLLDDFKRINIDLIYGTPNQTLAGWQDELAMAVELGVEHLSCYTLTLEPGTPFERAGLVMPSEKRGVLLFELTRTYLANHGYIPYEISNFARPGGICRHNINYWEYGDYLGIGAGAHGKWRDDQQRVWHSENPRDLTHYLKPPHSPHPPHQVTAEEAGKECIMMGLRLKWGLSRSHYQQITGDDFVTRHAHAIKELIKNNFLTITPDRIALTPQALLLTDEIILNFI